MSRCLPTAGARGAQKGRWKEACIASWVMAAVVGCRLPLKIIAAVVAMLCCGWW